jgi:sugar transferase (PEP-CTERM/EpsH1 system associated)
VRLLYLTPRFPHPELKGEQLAAYHRLVTLAPRHEISLLSFYERQDELSQLDRMRELCASVDVVELPKWRGVTNVAVGAPFKRLPLQLLYYSSHTFARLVARTAQERRFDVAHAFMLRMLPYLAQVDAPRILDALDSMTLRMRRNVEVERSPRGWLFREELRRVTGYERSLGDSVDRVLVASERDRDSFAGASVVVVPNGVDAERFRPDAARRQPARIVFSGRMSYPPNVRAAVWFAQECFPRVQADVPEARFVVAGAAPAREVRRLRGLPGVEVTGFVDSMAEILNTASVAVAPMQSGAGIQNKILEAMACGRSVVTTTIGLGGIAARPGVDLVVADGVAEFAAAVAELLRDEDRAAELGRNARARVLERYTWERAADAVDRVYAELAADLPETM